jgi:TonB family protein
MRRILLTSLFVSSVLLHAQTATKGQSVTLEASNSAPAALASSASMSDASSTAPIVRISTGVTQPRLLSKPIAKVTPADFNSLDPNIEEMLVHVNLNSKGVPQSVEVLKPVNPQVDQRIMEAVSHYQFSPGKVDGMAVDSDIYLKIRFNVH